MKITVEMEDGRDIDVEVHAYDMMKTVVDSYYHNDFDLKQFISEIGKENVEKALEEL